MSEREVNNIMYRSGKFLVKKLIDLPTDSRYKQEANMFKDNVENIIDSEETDLRKLQLVILEIMKVIDEMCRANNIEYWIDSGTLLGSVRHGGFIPWDDDCDICMKREDYEKFEKIAGTNLPEGLFYDSKHTVNRCQKEVNIQPSFAKIYYLGHFKGYERASGEKCMGTFVDIFPCDSVNEKMLNKKWCKALNRISYFRKTRPSKFRDHIKLFLQNIKVENIWIDYCKRAKEKKLTDSIVYGVDTPFMDNRWRHRNEVVFPLKEYDFEGYKFYGPSDYDTYLKKYYGDYMSFPPEEERVPHIIDLEL